MIRRWPSRGDAARPLLTALVLSLAAVLPLPPLARAADAPSFAGARAAIERAHGLPPGTLSGAAPAARGGVGERARSPWARTPLASGALRTPLVRPSDGHWEPLPPPQLACTTPLLDPVRNRMIVLFGVSQTNVRSEVWTLGLAGPSTWQRLNVAGTPPVPRFGYAAAYDATHDRVLVYGGFTYAGLDTALSDLWALSLSPTPSWSRLATADPRPGPRAFSATAYDAVHDRLLLHGGWKSSWFIPAADSTMMYDDVWALNLSGAPAWMPIAAAGTLPAARAEACAAYDPAGDRLVVFGGVHADSMSEELLGDTWQLTLSGTPAWTQVATGPGAPAARNYAMMTMDVAHDRMLLMGGLAYGDDGAQAILSDVWSLALSGTPAWTPLVPAGPGPAERYAAGTLYDGAHDRWLVFGGSGMPDGVDYDVFGDTWALGLAGTTSWSVVAPGPSRLGARYLPAAATDAARDRVVEFGGWDGQRQLNDVAAFDLGTRTWSAIATVGSVPPTRTGAVAIVDPVRQWLVVHGGYHYDPVSGGGALYDTWALPLTGESRWRGLASWNGPYSRHDHSAIYDPVRERMIVYGGSDLGGAKLGDVWALPLAGTPAWEQLQPIGSPPPRSGHAAVYDAAGDRMIVFGGDGGPAFLSDTWALSLSGTPAWTPLTPAAAPAERTHPAAAYDAARRRLVVWGGLERFGPFEGVANDGLHVLDLAAPTAWTLAAPSGQEPDPALGVMEIADPARDRVLFTGGWLGGCTTEQSILSWGQVLDVPPAPAGALDVGAVHPSPGTGESRLAFTLAAPAHVAIGVFDVQGRRQRTLLGERLAAGVHEARWDGRREDGALAPAGLYFWRVTIDGRVKTRRVVRTN